MKERGKVKIDKMHESTLSNEEVKLLQRVINETYKGIIDGDKLETDFWHAPILMIGELKIKIDVHEEIIKKESELCRISASGIDIELKKNVMLEEIEQKIADVKIVRHYIEIKKNDQIMKKNHRNCSEIANDSNNYNSDIGLIFELEKFNIAFFTDTLSLFLTIVKYEKNINIIDTSYLSTFLKKQLIDKDVIMQRIKVISLNSL